MERKVILILSVTYLKCQIYRAIHSVINSNLLDAGRRTTPSMKISAS
jgi:hypothetical protein